MQCTRGSLKKTHMYSGTSTYKHMYICTYGCMYIRTHAVEPLHTNMYIHTYVYILWTYTAIHMYCMYIRTHTYSGNSTYTNTYVHTFELLNKGQNGKNINSATSVLCREIILFEDLKHIIRTNSEEIVLDFKQCPF